MAVYGQYETVAELGRTRTTTVSRARPADGGWDLGFDDLGSDANFVLKAFHVRQAEDAGGDEAQRFLDRAHAQQRAVELGARHWAPILEAGTAGEDAYYVAHYYPRTAQGLAHTAGGVDAFTLYAVVAGALQGLVELHRTLSRPHGNLKATNVLIRTRGAITPGDVLLTDPAVEQDATIAGEVEDLYNLGEVIHETVLGARFGGPRAWPVPPSPAWTKLGKKGNRWLALCNHLLSPRAAENWLRVDDILEEVAALRPRKSRLRSRKLWVALAALAVIAGAGVGEYFHYAGEWRRLCGAYGDWAGPMSHRLASDPPREITQDAYLQEHLVRTLDEARKNHVELDPRAIGGSAEPLSILAENPPLSFAAVWKTERAARVVRGIDNSLAPGRWQALADLTRRRADYDKRNWPRLVEYAASVSDAASREKGAGRVTAITAVLDGGARLARLDAARVAARTRLDHLVAHAMGASIIRDRIGEFEALLRASSDSDVLLPTAPAVDDLIRQLQSAEQTVALFDDAVPLLADAAKRQRAYEVRGWTGAATALGALIDRAKPIGQLAGLRDDLAAAKRGWEEAEMQWTQIETRRRLFETSGDRVLATYRQYVAQSGLGGASDLASLTRRLAEINRDPAWIAAAKKVAAPEWATFDVVDFAQKSQAHRGFAGKTVATAGDLKTWLSEVDDYGSQLASATMKPDSNLGKPGKGDTDPPQVMTVPRPPATIASATTLPTPSTTMAEVEPRPAPATMASADPKPAPTTMAAADIKPGPTTVAIVLPTPPPATAESFTINPSPTTMASATLRPSPTPKDSVLPTPTDLTLQKSTPTRIDSTHPIPTTLAFVTPTTAPTVQPTTVAIVAPPKPAPPPPDPEKLRLKRERQQREKEIAAFVAESREVSLKVTSHEIKDAWRTRNDQIVARIERDHGVFGPGIKDERETLRGRLLQLDSAYQSIVAPLTIKPPPAAWGTPLVNALQTAVPRRADELKGLITLATTGDPKFESSLRELDDLDTQWRAAAAHLVTDAARVEQLLELGYAPGNKGAADGSPLNAALASVREADLYKNTAAVQQALEPLLRPVSVVETENAPSAMRLLVAAGDQPLGVRLAAWSKAGREITGPTLDEDLKLAAALLATAQAKLTDKARIESIKKRLETDVRARWLRLFENARREQDVETAIAMREKINGAVAVPLPPRARFNLALHDMRVAASSAKGSGIGSEVSTAAENLKKVVATLEPAQAAEPAVASVVAEIDRLGQGAPPDFTTLGPTSDSARVAGAKITWNPVADPAGDKVTYRALIATDATKEEIALIFRRVRPATNGPASWVATTETSLGLFSDLISAAGKWPDVRGAKLLPDYPARRDPRPGPRIWEWSLYARSPEITKTVNWLSDGFVPYGVDHYPRAIASDLNRSQIGNAEGERAEALNPSRRQPMQYLSPRAATFAALLAGCRLPTVAEWQAANQSVEKHLNVNLRDRTWEIELEHMSKRAFAGRCRPDAGMFVPAGEDSSDKIYPRVSGGELNDGVLWFHEVPAAAPVFVDLIGNVGEFVTDDAGKVYVIGGSALSPPTRPLDKPFGLAADQLTSGFSDVGFRLAFSEPAPGIEKLKGVLAASNYLLAK
jgi:hypothetical protein